jgi:hypothetical protein
MVRLLQSNRRSRRAMHGRRKATIAYQPQPQLQIQPEPRISKSTRLRLSWLKARVAAAPANRALLRRTARATHVGVPILLLSSEGPRVTPS